MQAALRDIIQGSVLRRLRVGVRVVDARTGRLFYSQRDGVLMDPASNQKVLATTTALMRLGADWRFRTELSGVAPSPDGTVVGDVYLRGNGDPTLSQRRPRRARDRAGPPRRAQHRRAPLPACDRVARHRIHLHLEREQVIAALDAVAGVELVEEELAVQALTHQPPLHVREGNDDRVDGAALDVRPQLVDAQHEAILCSRALPVDNDATRRA